MAKVMWEAETVKKVGTIFIIGAVLELINGFTALPASFKAASHLLQELAAIGAGLLGLAVGFKMMSFKAWVRIAAIGLLCYAMIPNILNSIKAPFMKAAGTTPMVVLVSNLITLILKVVFLLFFFRPNVKAMFSRKR